MEGTARSGKSAPQELAVFRSRRVTLSFASKMDQGSLSAVVRRRQPWPFQGPPGRILAV